jgi:hypothetical protein
MIGTEHEFSITDSQFRPKPISDELIRRVSGEIADEVPFGDLFLSKELQKHAIELIPQKPRDTLASLESSISAGVARLFDLFGGDCRFLGLGMHPLLQLHETMPWDHNEGEYYRAYDRLFNIKQHGWLNIQALQINFPFGDMERLVPLFNRTRAIMPYVVAVSASSPFVEGRIEKAADNRLIYYRENQKQIPLICGGILPVRLNSVKDYIDINRSIYRQLIDKNASILAREWVNSRGVIVRFTRGCLEVKAIDEQECIRSDMAVTAFLLALLRADISIEEDDCALRGLLEEAIMNGTAGLRQELMRLYKSAENCATPDERAYLPIVKRRIEEGSLSEVMAARAKDNGIEPLLCSLEESLRRNEPYFGRKGD